MRVLKFIRIFIVAFILLSGCSKTPTEEYYEHLNNSNVIEITDKELKELDISGQTFILFIGRPTCQYCRQFVPKLEKANKQFNRKIYYINSEKYLKSYLAEFRSKYNIKFVPTLIHIQDNHLVSKTKNGSKTTVKEISQILE